MKMLDQGEQDDKIIAVHHDDPEFTHYTDISQLPPHRMAEIRGYFHFKNFSIVGNRFFEDYKKNEQKEVVVDDILDAEVARTAVKASIVRKQSLK